MVVTNAWRAGCLQITVSDDCRNIRSPYLLFGDPDINFETPGVKARSDSRCIDSNASDKFENSRYSSSVVFQRLRSRSTRRIRKDSRRSGTPTRAPQHLDRLYLAAKVRSLQKLGTTKAPEFSTSHEIPPATTPQPAARRFSPPSRRRETQHA